MGRQAELGDPQKNRFLSETERKSFLFYSVINPLTAGLKKDHCRLKSGWPDRDVDQVVPLRRTTKSRLAQKRPSAPKDQIEMSDFVGVAEKKCRSAPEEQIEISAVGLLH